MKKLLLSILCLFSIIAVRADEVTLSFADKAQRTSQTTSEQVWEQNGIILTNNKGKSTSNVADYAKPARFYKNSELIIECTLGNITAIEFDCNSNAYATSLQKSIGGGATVSEDKVTVALDGTSATYTIEALSDGQVRMDALTITYAAEETGATIAKPVTSVEAGAIYNPADVELTAEAGTIYYTLDGTEPTAESAVYESPISINQFGTTTIIKAIAIDGEEFSDVATYSYTLKVAAPVANYNTGVYSEIRNLEFTSETEGAKVIAVLVNKYNYSVKEHGSKYFSTPIREKQNEYHIIASVEQDGNTIWSDSIVKKYYLSSIAPFKKATSIVSGTKYLINANNIVADHIYDYNTNGYLYTKNITKKADYIETNGYYGFTFEETENAGEYYIIDVFNRYLYMKGTYTSFNVSADNSELGDDAVWTVSFNEDGAAIITNKGKNATIQFSTQYNSYGSYVEISSANVLPTLYAESEYPTFTVTANGETEDGMTYKKFTGITITCEAGIELMPETDELSPTYTIGWDYTPHFFDFGQQVDEKTIVYNLVTEITESETYRITIPAGAFTLDPNGLGMTSEEGWINVTVDNSAPFAITSITPTDGSVVDVLDSLVVEYTRDLGGDNLWQGVTVTDADGNIVTYFDEEEQIEKEVIFNISYTDAEGNSLPYNVVTLVTDTPITKAGTYYFNNIQEWGFVYGSNWNMEYIDGVISCAITVTGNATGINEIESEMGEKSIFDITGRQIKEITAPGIYIINGVKTIVK